MTKADIQLVRALADKRGRTEHGLFVAEGEKLIGELRASHLSVRRIFSLEGVFNGPEVETVAPRDMERLSLLKTPSNSLALVEIPRCDLKPERLGAILRVRVHYTDLAALLSKAAALGLPVCGTFLEGANIYETELKPAGIVVMGNEGRGITDAVARTVTQKLFIPPWPADRRGSESLNVAMATGIVCGEFRRQASAKAGK